MNENEKNLDPQDEIVENQEKLETDNLTQEEAASDVTSEAETSEEPEASEEKKEEKRGLFGKKNKKEEELKKTQDMLIGHELAKEFDESGNSSDA